MAVLLINCRKRLSVRIPGKEVNPLLSLEQPLRLAAPTTPIDKHVNPIDRKRVLVIDDEEGFCTFVSWALEKTGQYTVTSTTKPLEGINLAKALRPDLILLDIKMPQMDGSKVAEKLLEDAQTKSIPIAFVTALVTNRETKHQQMEVAGRTFIAKPITRDELLQAVSRLLA
jgi:CheY-like chemotaxis protein